MSTATPKSYPTAAPTVGWSSVSVATLLILFRPDAAALYLPLVLVALVASIICLAARRLGHGLALLAFVLLMPALIVESAVSMQLTKPIAPPFSAARSDRPQNAGVRTSNADNEPVVDVSFMDQGREAPAAAAPSRCIAATERGRQASAQSPANCRPDRG